MEIAKHKKKCFYLIKSYGCYNLLDHRTRKLTPLTKKEWWYMVFDYSQHF